MAEKRIVVPEGMLKAAEDSGAGCGTRSVELILESALCWLSENPIAPTKEQQTSLWLSWKPIYESPNPIEDQILHSVTEWQRRMFIREPELPPEIERLIRQSVSPIHEKTIREAYEIGRKSVSK